MAQAVLQRSAQRANAKRLAEYIRMNGHIHHERMPGMGIAEWRAGPFSPDRGDDRRENGLFHMAIPDSPTESTQGDPGSSADVGMGIVQDPEQGRGCAVMARFPEGSRRHHPHFKGLVGEALLQGAEDRSIEEIRR